MRARAQLNENIERLASAVVGWAEATLMSLRQLTVSLQAMPMVVGAKTVSVDREVDRGDSYTDAKADASSCTAAHGVLVRTMRNSCNY
ncbi:MAG TPA: hypothetical protein VJT85_05670 [Gemmatimonadaceae bacterium]|nr:hypothetical protein [Gemmatimonadaceae bacterium]